MTNKSEAIEIGWNVPFARNGVLEMMYRNRVLFLMLAVAWGTIPSPPLRAQTIEHISRVHAGTRAVHRFGKSQLDPASAGKAQNTPVRPSSFTSAPGESRTASRSVHSITNHQLTAPEASEDVDVIDPMVAPEYFHDGDTMCGSCDGAGCYDCMGLYCGVLPCGSWWFRAEYLLWWTDGMSVPPLVTTSPDSTAQAVAGVLGEPTTSILFGDSKLNEQSRSGGGVTVGYWWLPEIAGIEARYFGLGQKSTNYQASSGGSPILARPFFNMGTGANDAQLVAFPGLNTGSISVDASSDFDTVEVLLRRSLCGECDTRLDFLVGYRYGGLDDSLRITQSSVDTGGPAPGSTTRLFDRFDTENRFNGAEFGVNGQFRQCRWTWEVEAKLALGNTNSRLFVDGQTTTTDVGGASTTRPEGFLAQSTNIGRFESDNFAVIPEVGVSVHQDITCRLRATFGYRFLYLSQVARAGDQIDLDLNLSEPFAGASRPTVEMPLTDFWAQGLHFGLDYRY